MAKRKNKPADKASLPDNKKTAVIFNSNANEAAIVEKMLQLKSTEEYRFFIFKPTPPTKEFPKQCTFISRDCHELDDTFSDTVIYIEIDKLKSDENPAQLIPLLIKITAEGPSKINFKADKKLTGTVNDPVLFMDKKNFKAIVANPYINSKNLNYALNSFFNHKQNEPAYTEIAKPSPFERIKLPSLISRIRYWFNFLIREPLRDIKKEGLSFSGESSIYRFLFTTFAALTFVLMSVFSFDAGNSGDEITLIRQAEKTFNFFATGGKDKSAIDTKGRDPMYAYGQSFDLVTYAVSQWLNIDDLYALRHLVNTWLGWLAMLFAGLLAVSLLGWRAGFLTFVFIALSPRFLGHSWNNPKDIPFAFGFIFTLYFTFRFIKHLPRVSYRNLLYIALGFAFTNSIRIGGLLLVAYVGLFIGIKLISLYGLKNLFKGSTLKYIFKLAKAVILFLAGGYFLGILLWPYALMNPIKNPVEALNLMTNFEISLRQLFEGSIIWSDQLPWYYALKYMLFTIPLFIFGGLAFSVLNLKNMFKNTGGVNLFLLFFIWLFPIFYTIYKDSNLYGGWRHLIFSYPPLVIIAAAGFENLYRSFKSKYIHFALTAIIVALTVKPAIHTFKNHPHQYVYYNEIAGGVKGVWGEYELDYYFHSFKEASEWLIENELKERFDTEKKLIVRTNAGAKYFFKDYSDFVDASYMRYYERGNENWDYALIVNTYINPSQLNADKWPPSNTIHTIDIDGYPICAVLKRKSKKDYEAYRAFKAKDFSKAVTYYNEALKVTPDNEAALLNLAQIYQNFRQLDKSEQTVKKCLKVYPDYDRALAQLGLVYLMKNELNKAAKTFTQAIQVNKKYGPAYYYMALIYQNTGDAATAEQYANQAIEASPRFKPAYVLLANLMRANGQDKKAEQILNIANSL